MRFSDAYARKPAVARRGLAPGRRVFTSIAAALERLLRDPGERARMAAAGPARAAEFSWTRTAEIVLDTLERVARPPRRRR